MSKHNSVPACPAYRPGRRQAGFSIIEVIVSIGIMLILLGLTTPFVVHFYKRYQVDGERSTLVTILRQARTMSMSGEGRKDHGVHIATESYTLFEGPSYAGRDTEKDQDFGKSDGVIIVGGTEILFHSLSGKSASTSLTLDNGTKTSHIYVNTEGRIDWE